jgi:stearoyl-CoA desaturase (delta-9 desaturase)
MGRELTALWERSSDSSDELLARLQAWCRRAEASNIVALQNFSRRLRSMCELCAQKVTSRPK